MPDLWLDDVARGVLRGVGWTLAVALWTWTAFAAGEARMASLTARVHDDATYCSDMLGELLTQAERAARVTEETRAELVRRLSQRVPAGASEWVAFGEVAP